MGTITIIQPGKIGDIIICLPIANYFAQKGYSVIWPIPKYCFNMFADAVDYVSFLELKSGHKAYVKESLNVAEENKTEVLNLSFGFPGMEKEWHKWRSTPYHFDEYKYKIANVPFEQKWNLKIKRSTDREQKLFNSLEIKESYLVYQNKSSDTSLNMSWLDSENNLRKIPIEQLTDNVFDWITVLEKAEKLVLIDSCFVNLVDQLKIATAKRRLLKPLYVKDQDYPILKGEWQ